MKKITLVLLVLVAVALPTFALAGSSDQGRRLTGPFCINNTQHGPWAGVVRSVAKTRACRKGEIRKVGLGLNFPKGAGAPGVQGIQGAQGTKGDTGAQGERGPKGDRGPKGNTGAQGVSGPKGDKGDPGAPGDKGDKGDKGDPGSLDGTDTLTVCVTGGGNGGVTAGACNGNGDTWKLYGVKQ